MDAVGHTIKPGYHVTFKVQAMEISPSPELRNIHFKRRVRNFEDIKKQKLDRMPGFRFTWYYSGGEIEQVGKYLTDSSTRLFVRKLSIFLHNSLLYDIEESIHLQFVCTSIGGLCF